MEQLEELLAPYLEAQAEQFPYEQVEAVLATHIDLGTQRDSTNPEDPLPDELDAILTGWLGGAGEGIEEALPRVLTAAALAGFSLAFAKIVKELGLTLRPGSEMLARLRQWAQGHSAGVFEEHRRAMTARIRRIISKALGSGSPLADIIARIRAFLDDRPKRAEQMARHEAAVARAHGIYEANRALGATTKRWFTCKDERVCPVCELNELQGDIPITQVFSSGHYCRPAHTSCRCVVGYAGITRQSALQAL